ncbi:MAG: ATP-binding protein [Acholeplasmatales bacterium]|nr:ATP-binding protein [Acholeplasmatales bacterium]
MLWRKKQKDIVEWIRKEKKALLITGARQIGKTYIIREMLKQENCDYVEFNLIEQPEMIKVLEAVTNNNSQAFIERLSIATSHKLVKGKTIIFFDEIQEYKEIVTKIKFLVDDGSFKYVFSGSLLGVELTGLKSAPVGYLNTIEMFPLDFEEYSIALNIKKETLERLYKAFEEKRTVDDFVHEKMLEAFRSYLLVGGMPEAVNSYVNDHDYNEIYKIHLNIIEQYKLDFTKYEKEKRLKLKSIYNLIPSELADKNKRYIFKDIDPNIKFDRYENSFNWLIDAGVAIPVYNATEPRLPLEINKKSNLFKLFLSDIGLLTSLYGKATQMAIMNQDLSLNCGAIYENVVAQELNSHGYDGYYFNSHKQGELDFVIEYKNHIVPIEVKSGKDYRKHSALDNVVNNKDYGVKEAFVFSNANISVDDKIIYYPIYMIMFVNEEMIEIPKLKKIDLSII